MLPKILETCNGHYSTEALLPNFLHVRKTPMKCLPVDHRHSNLFAFDRSIVKNPLVAYFFAFLTMWHLSTLYAITACFAPCLKLCFLKHAIKCLKYFCLKLYSGPGLLTKAFRSVDLVHPRIGSLSSDFLCAKVYPLLWGQSTLPLCIILGVPWTCNYSIFYYLLHALKEVVNLVLIWCDFLRHHW